MANDEVSIAVLASKVDMIHSSVSDMRLALQDLTQAIITLARVEERQTQLATEQGRILTTLDKMDGRIQDIEAAEPLQKQTSTWMMSVVWAAAGMGVLMLLRKLGIT